MNTIISNIINTNKFYTVSEIDSFKRMIETPLGSRVIRPKFGSLLHELIDMNMDDEFKMLLTRNLLTCFYDNNNIPWDDRWIPISVDLVRIDSITNEIVVRVNFDDSEIELNLGGF